MTNTANILMKQSVHNIMVTQIITHNKTAKKVSKRVLEMWKGLKDIRHRRKCVLP